VYAKRSFSSMVASGSQNQIWPSCCAALPSLKRAKEQATYAPPSPHHMPSNSRLRVTAPPASCLRVDVVRASRSGTVTHATR